MAEKISSPSDAALFVQHHLLPFWRHSARYSFGTSEENIRILAKTSLGVIVFEDFVKPTLVDKCKLRVEHGGDLIGSNVIMDDIAKSIKKSRFLIADLTGKNANVFYEVGIEHALNKEVLLMTQSIDDVPFDLRHRRILVYECTPRGCKRLEADLYENVQNMLSHAPAA